MRSLTPAVRGSFGSPSQVRVVTPARSEAHVRRQRRLSLWLPLTPLALLLATPAMALAPLIRIDRRWRGAPASRIAWAIGTLLLSLSGTSIEIETPRLRLRLRIL